jgi:hypothetical protein
MAKTVADYQVLIDLLDDAIGRGVKSVTIDGMRTDYANTDDMIKAQSWMRARQAALNPAAPKSYSYAQVSKDGRGNNPNG